MLDYGLMAEFGAPVTLRQDFSSAFVCEPCGSAEPNLPDRGGNDGTKRLLSATWVGGSSVLFSSQALVLEAQADNSSS